MCVWSVSRKIRATVSCNGHFMVIMVRTAGNFEGMALAQAASHWRKTNPFRHWTCVCSCEHDKNLCTSFVCEVSAKKYAQLYHVRARGPPFVNHRLHHCWKGFLCARGSTRELHADLQASSPQRANPCWASGPIKNVHFTWDLIVYVAKKRHEAKTPIKHQH